MAIFSPLRADFDWSFLSFPIHLLTAPYTILESTFGIFEVFRRIMLIFEPFLIAIYFMSGVMLALGIVALSGNRRMSGYPRLGRAGRLIALLLTSYIVLSSIAGITLYVRELDKLKASWRSEAK